MPHMPVRLDPLEATPEIFSCNQLESELQNERIKSHL